MGIDITLKHISRIRVNGITKRKQGVLLPQASVYQHKLGINKKFQFHKKYHPFHCPSEQVIAIKIIYDNTARYKRICRE